MVPKLSLPRCALIKLAVREAAAGHVLHARSHNPAVPAPSRLRAAPARTNWVSPKPQRARRRMPVHQRPRAPEARQHCRHMRVRCTQRCEQQLSIAGAGGDVQGARREDLPIEHQHVAASVHEGRRAGCCTPQLQQRTLEVQQCRAAGYLLGGREEEGGGPPGQDSVRAAAAVARRGVQCNNRRGSARLSRL